MGFLVEPTSYSPPAIPIPDIKIKHKKVQYNIDTKDRFYHTLITNVMCVVCNTQDLKASIIYLYNRLGWYIYRIFIVSTSAAAAFIFN